MITETDKLRARFAANDRVMFSYRNQQLIGTVLRTNPKRAVITVDEKAFSVPYERLQPIGYATEQREQRVDSILRLALVLMEENNLKGWRFRFDHSTRRAGCCNYRNKMISISFHLACTGKDADIRDTILHEIAHALVGKKHNHDAIWRAKAMEIGCSGERCHRLEFAPPRYQVRCENHCWTHTAQRRNPRLVCRKCGGRLVYSTYIQA